MSNIQTIAPQNVRQHFARAKSLLKRNDTLRALEALMAGLEVYEPGKLTTKARFETEVLIQECATDIGRQPLVRGFFEQIAKASKATISYTPGEEDKLTAVLGLLLKGLRSAAGEKEANEQGSRDMRRSALEQKGLEYLRNGDATRGKSALRVLAEEFGEDPGVLTQVGVWLEDAKLYFEAAEFLEQALERFPKDSRAYATATSVYATLREYEKAEAVYLKALKEFGKHPRTLLNLAKIYVSWNKKDKAFEAAREAYKGDPSLTEAKELVDRLG